MRTDPLDTGAASVIMLDGLALVKFALQVEPRHFVGKHS